MPYSRVLLRLLALAVELQAARGVRWRKDPAVIQARSQSSGSLVAIPLSALSSEPLPQADALREYCATLKPAQIYMAVVVMYAGRGDFGSTFDIMDCYQKMSDAFRSPEWAVQKLLDKEPLPQFLAAGIRILTEMGCDIDSLC